MTKHNVSRSSKGLLVVLALLVVVTFVAYPFAIQRWLLTSEERAQFGASFGALSALFSGLAFGVVAAALVYQHRQLLAQQAAAEGATRISTLTTLLAMINTIIDEQENGVNASQRIDWLLPFVEEKFRDPKVFNPRKTALQARAAIVNRLTVELDRQGSL